MKDLEKKICTLIEENVGDIVQGTDWELKGGEDVAGYIMEVVKEYTKSLISVKSNENLFYINKIGELEEEICLQKVKINYLDQNSDDLEEENKKLKDDVQEMANTGKLIQDKMKELQRLKGW